MDSRVYCDWGKDLSLQRFERAGQFASAMKESSMMKVSPLSAAKPLSLEEKAYGSTQRTLFATTVFSGIGVHSGLPARIEVRPAEENTGIVFVTAEGFRLPASFEYLHAQSGDLCTMISSGDAVVSTIEHLMAAFAFCGIDNAEVVLFGEELPILDGSSAPFVEKFADVGLIAQTASRRFLRVDESFTHRGENGSWVRFDPIKNGEAATLSVEVDYRGVIDFIGVQSLHCRMAPKTLRTELMASRTFGHEDWRIHYQAEGKGRGASTENTVLYTNEGYVNPDGLRFDDEAVRHKSLDLIGDLFLAGWPLLGHISAFKPGHKINADALIGLLRSGNCDLFAW